MPYLSHPVAALSISLAALAGVAGVAAESIAPRAKTPYFGRWTVSDPNERFSARGKPYTTIDIAPCGKDFCGVSVGDKGQCGPVLFRFLMRNVAASSLHGHAPWGRQRKNIQIVAWDNPETPGGRDMEIYVGDGYDFGGRSDSMPKFNAMYKRTGDARCRAR